MSSHIPFHLQEEIIIRLPVESLIRFRSVCKAWKSLIDCSEFIAAYSVRHTQPQHLLIMYQAGFQDEVKYVSSYVDDDSFPQQKFALAVPVPPLVQRTAIVIGSSDGLLCLTCFFCQTEIAVLWNPAIRKSISVAVRPDNVVHWPFDYVIGFGVCPDTKDPKLVKITYISDFKINQSISCIPSQVMVFTLSSGEWTTLCSSSLPRKSIEFTYFQTVIGQFIYLLAYDWSVVDCKYRALIMSFDMSTQEFTEIDLPDCLANVHQSDLFVSRLRGSLVLIKSIQIILKKRVCEVWMMEHNDPKAFTKVFTIDAPDASVSHTLGFRKNGEPIIEMQGGGHTNLKRPYALVVYEPCSQHFTVLAICGFVHSLFADSYTESLLLHDHKDGHIVRCGGAVKSFGVS